MHKMFSPYQTRRRSVFFPAGIWFVAVLITLQPVFGNGHFSVLHPQATSSNLSGMVLDETDAVIPNAQVTLINNQTGFQRSKITDQEGFFIFSLLPPGSYSLIVEVAGFEPYSVNDISLLASVNTSVDIALRPKPIKESVDVTTRYSLAADTNTVDISNATVKHSVTNEQVVHLPVLTTTLGRNTLGVLSFLIPGVSPATYLGVANPDSNRFGHQMSVNGSRPTSISFNLETGDNNDQENNRSVSPFPNPDALQEFTIVTNNYQADLGRSSGGIVNAVVKSGSQTYQGNLRYFLINEAFNARSFFDAEKPLDRVHTFGGQIGGPTRLPSIFKGLFFLDYEVARAYRETTSNLIVLSALERRGDFSQSSSASWPIDPQTHKRFKNGIIPQASINPISRIYLDRFIPLPNSGDRNFRQLLPVDFQNDQITARFDKEISPSDNLSATYFLIDFDVISGLTSLPVGSKSFSNFRNQNLILRETHIFATHTVNQLSVAATYYVNASQFFSPGATGTPPSEFGFTGIHPQSDRFLSAPSISINGTDIRVAPVNQFRDLKTSWQIKDDLSHQHGKQTWKFGGEVRGFLQQTQSGNNNGEFIFLSAFSNGTFNPIADFLLGIPNFYRQTSGNSRYPRQRVFSLYAMDDWRVKHNLTINMGLRYEFSPPFVDKLDQLSVFRPDQQSVKFPYAPIGMLFPGDPDPLLGKVPRGGYRADQNDFAPRLGLAYSPASNSGWMGKLFGNGKSAIRAGGGIFYDQTFGLNFTQSSLTQPFSITQSLTPSQLRATQATLANPFGNGLNPWPIELNRGIFTQTPTIQAFDPNFRTAYSYHYNLTVQRELPGALLLELAYVGNNSFKLNREREINTANVDERDLEIPPQSRRRYPHLGNIPLQESSGRARYDSLQIKISRRLKNGFTFDAYYVYSKALDNGSVPFSAYLADPFRWAPSSFNRTHSFVANYSYTLPEVRLKGIPQALLKGWQVSGITQMNSGLPIDIIQNFDIRRQDRVIGALGVPDFTGNFVKLNPREFKIITVNGTKQSGNFLFDPNSFRQVSAKEQRQGTVGRNLFDGPGINLTSFSLSKRMRISETQQISLRADIRNLLNRAHFDVQTNSLRVDSPSLFGRVTTAAPGRNMQLSLRYSF